MKMRDKMTGTAVALALIAASAFTSWHCLDAPIFKNDSQRGNVEVKRELEKKFSHVESIFNLPASLGLLSAVASGMVQSIQVVSVTIAASSASNTQVITAVNLSNACIIPGGWTSASSSGADAFDDFGGWDFSDSTHARANRGNASAAAAITLKGTVVEWKSAAIQSVQSGTVTTGVSSTTGTQAVSSVTTTNAILIWTGQKSSASQTSSQTYTSYITLTSATQITITRDTAAVPTVTAYFFLVEFKASRLNSNTQNGIVTYANGGTATATLGTAVVIAQSWLVFGGISVNNNAANQSENGYIQLTGTTTVTFTSLNTGAYVAKVSFFVAEFKSSDTQSQNQNVISLASGNASTDSGTWTAVNPALAWCQYLGHAITGSTTTANAVFLAVILNALNTKATGTRNTGGAFIVNVAFQVFELKA